MSGTEVKDAVVFVTGANRGIGRAIAEEAVARGASRVYAAARSTAGVQDLVEANPDTVVAIELDVNNADQIAAAASAASDTQILINNAGVAAGGGFIFAHNADGAQLEMNTNYFGPLNVSRAFADSIIANGNGAIGIVASVAGWTNFPMAATYSASKAAARSLCQGMRAELAPQGVAVFGIYPGPIDTDMAAGIELDKESPANVATKIFDDMANGVSEIATDAFAIDFLKNLSADPKAVEASTAQMAHQPD